MRAFGDDGDGAFDAAMVTIVVTTPYSLRSLALERERVAHSRF